MSKSEQRHSILLRLVSIALGILAPLFILEVVLRFLPVSDSLYALPVTSDQPYKHFKENRDITYSKGWNFAIVSRKHVNNAGFLSDTDYTTKHQPVHAIIGDSYVEAMQVSNAESVQGILQSQYQKSTAVYAFGASGAPLSQYLAYAELAKIKYAAESITVVVISNDFDESLLKYKSTPGFHYFRAHGNIKSANDLTLKLVPFRGISLQGRLLLSSAFARYLTKTVGISPARVMAEMFDDNSNAADPMLEYAGNVPYSAEKQRVQDSIHAIDAFFRLLPVKSGLEPSKILLVIDGIRPHLYSEAGLGKAQGSYFSQMRAYFIDQASNLGYEFVDLQDVFKYNYLNHQKRFEFPTDAHWNAHGHAVVAEAIGNSKLFSHTVSGIGPKPNSRESGQP